MSDHITRKMEKLSDIYALTADMLDNTTGDWPWYLGLCRMIREDGGITIDGLGNGEGGIHFDEPGAAGDYLIRRIGFMPGQTWVGCKDVTVRSDKGAK